MADQTLAQDSTLGGTATQEQRQDNTLRYKFAWRWAVVRCWARYVLAGRQSGVPGLVDFVLGNRYLKAIQVPSELTALGEIISDLHPQRAMEIGTAFGGTLFFLTRLASPVATIVSLDLPPDLFGRREKSLRWRAYRHLKRGRQRLHLLRGDSHSRDMLARAQAALRDQPLDYLFIDGDHSYEGVKRDFEMYAPLVRKGGVVAFHDIAEHPPAVGCEVSRFWNEAKQAFRHTEIIENPKQGWGGIGILYVE